MWVDLRNKLILLQQIKGLRKAVTLAAYRVNINAVPCTHLDGLPDCAAGHPQRGAQCGARMKMAVGEQ